MGVLVDQPALGSLGRIKRTIQQVVNRLGYQVQSFPAPHSYERHLRDLFAAERVNCVIDVGAHHGGFYRILRGTGYRGRVVSFEPLRENFARLERETTGDPEWHGYNTALGREAGTVTMNVPHRTEFASFLRPNTYCDKRFPWAGWEGLTVPVRVERLEQRYAELVRGIETPRVFLKMDTQGWDSEVLEGAGEALADVVGLQSEISAIPLYHGMRNLEESIAHYIALGFELTNLFPVSFDSDDLRVIEYDCVMRRTTPRPSAGC